MVPVLVRCVSSGSPIFGSSASKPEFRSSSSNGGNLILLVSDAAKRLPAAYLKAELGMKCREANLVTNTNKGSQRFGGDWTRTKLTILGEYLDNYTTALKNQDLRISYIDAFAGTGAVEVSQAWNGDQREFLNGSAQIAYDVRDRKFDKLVFIEKDSDKANRLLKNAAG